MWEITMQKGDCGFKKWCESTIFSGGWRKIERDGYVTCLSNLLNSKVLVFNFTNYNFLEE